MRRLSKTKAIALTSMLKAYYTLAKPGIIYGNSITCIAGFLFASNGQINVLQLLASVLGTALVIAAGCVFNNYLDREIDAKMTRTQKRALVSGEITGRSALIFACLLAASGLAVLAFFVNMLTVYLGIFALFSYIVVYGFAKRRSVLGTIVGSVPGSMSLVAGYAAVTNRLGTGALLLFLILALWQLPHFYAIAIFRSKEYAAAKIPVLPVVHGVRVTKMHIVTCIGMFVIAAALLTVFGYAGYSYLVVVSLIGLWWLRLGIHGFAAQDDNRWARKTFGFSLLVLLVFSFMLSVDAWLP